jgi:acetyl-CoA carboxylase, biotin carboxylase subunit
VRDADELNDSFTRTQREAEAAFSNGALYIEKFLERPRHIEVQICGDSQGNVVHLGERDCSVQRRHQKVVEEALSPALNDPERTRLGDMAVNAMKRLGYSNLGTVEFLYANGEFYFIEMNTRLQVEHPVTELITGIDLVREQIRIATGAPLSFTQDEVRFEGHAIECRITAEDPHTFMPSPGRVTSFHQPGGMSVRVDSALYAGYTVPPNYDSLIAKLIVHGRNRIECMMRLRRALEEFVIDGISTTIPLHQRLVENQDFANGDYDVGWLERLLANGEPEQP